MKKLLFTLFGIVMLLACSIPQEVVYVVVTATPEPRTITVVPVPTLVPVVPTPTIATIPATPIVVAPSNSNLPADVLSNFTPNVLRWGDRIVAWSAQYGISVRKIAVLMQAASCGNPDYVSGGNDRFGLFAVSYFHFDRDENMLDPEINAARGLAYFSTLPHNADTVWAYYAYFDGAGLLAQSAPWNVNDVSVNAQDLWMKSRTGAQICPG